MSGRAAPAGGGEAVRHLLDSLPAGCWIHSKGRIRYANSAFARLLGLSDPGQLIGAAADRLLVPESRQVLQWRAAEALGGGEVPPAEEEFVLADGRRVAVEVETGPVDWEGRRMVVSFFHDVTAKRQAEAARRQSELRFRRLFEGEIAGVIELDASGIVEANDAFLTMIGRTREDLRRGALGWEELGAPESLAADREALRKLLETGECKPFEKELVRPDGTRVPVLMGSSLLAPEPAWRAICLALDLTDRRKLQEIRAEKMRLESVEALAAGMAHNLNNLLTGVIGNASLLLDSPLLPEDSRARPVVREILLSGERAAGLTSQLLAYAGQGRFMVGPTDVREVVESQIEQMRNEIPPNVRLDLRLGPCLPILSADANQLRHLLIGLLINAVEAIGNRPDGRIEVEARTERPAENVAPLPVGEPLPPGEYCVLEVRDNGAGMDNRTLARAFEPFYTTKFPGRGLGLAAIAGIVRASGGGIRVASAPGEGSVFTVWLPVRDVRP